MFRETGDSQWLTELSKAGIFYKLLTELVLEELEFIIVSVQYPTTSLLNQFMKKV